MQIEEYNETRRADWDAFVAAHPHASFRHLSGLFALEAEISGARNRSLMIYDERGRLVGLLPLFEVVERALRYLRLRTLNSGTTLPGGPLFDLSLSAKQERDLLAELMAHVETLARSIGAERVSISYPNVIGDRTSIAHYGYLPLRRFGYREHNIVGLLLDLSASATALFAQLKSACRNMIRRAERDGLTWHVITDRAEWLACHALNVQTLGAHAYTPRAFEIIWDEFVAKDTASVGTAKVGGRIASVCVVVGLRTSCYYWLGFNARPPLATGANNFALWHSILLWQQRGARFFELGSMEFDDARQQQIGAFKESFGGTPCYALGGARELKPHRRIVRELLTLARARVQRRKRKEPVSAAQKRNPKQPPQTTRVAQHNTVGGDTEAAALPARKARAAQNS
jgi:Acetyltransferase (GNAT) domain